MLNKKKQQLKKNIKYNLIEKIIRINKKII